MTRAPDDRRPLPLGVSAPFALGAGLLTSLGFAPLAWWWGLLVGVALFGALVFGAPRSRTALALGALFGLGFQGPALLWQAQISVASYVGLVILEVAFYVALAAGLFAVRSLRWAPVAAAAVWVLVEFVQARVPFGGFGWTRLGYAVIDTPLAGLYPFVGAGAVTFAVALIAHALVWFAQHPGRRRALTAGAAAASLLALGGLGTLLPAPTGPTIDVGWVQGGAPGGGIYGIGEPGTMGRNHARATRHLLEKVRAGQAPAPAFIVWPENGTDTDPLADADTGALLTAATQAAGVPIFVTVPLSGPGWDERQTSALWWTPAGPQARYDKRNLVPFGEWIPFRDQLLPLIPMLRYVGAQTIPGTTPGALPVTTVDGQPLTVGVAICYEVAFPETVADAVNHGGEVMIVQSSNAMFQGTPQIEQQFAITRVRAAELRRQILVVTTSGISGLIDEHGAVVLRGIEHDADSGVVTLTRSTARTPLLVGGWLLEWIVAGLGVVAVAIPVIGRSRLGRWGRMDATRDERRNDG